MSTVPNRSILHDLIEMGLGTIKPALSFISLTVKGLLILFFILPLNYFIMIQLKVAALHYISLKLVLLLSIKYHDFMFALLIRPPPGIKEKYAQAVQLL